VNPKVNAFDVQATVLSVAGVVRVMTGAELVADTELMVMTGPVAGGLLMPLESVTVTVGVACRWPTAEAAG
jgi:archaellum component FlaF (FlaF/FlaG flagellin family)